MEAPLRVASHHDVTVVSLDGELDVVAADALRAHLTALIRAGHTHLVADLTGVSFLDSTGLGVLVGALKRTTDAGGSISLVVDQDRLMKILRVSALTQVFPIHRTLDRALTTV